jgi:alanine racemase
LVAGVYAFGRNGQTQTLTQADQCVDDTRAFALGRHCMDEAVVDFHLVDPEIASGRRDMARQGILMR